MLTNPAPSQPTSNSPDDAGASKTRPFLKWAGSKQRLLKDILPLLPSSFGTYYEPFLGSGAIFFALKPKKAILSDLSPELINTWKSVKSNPETIISYLIDKKPNKELYYSIRSARSHDPIIRAAEFLYLNKTCWNGLYRVNAKGQFNVPYGAPRSDNIVDPENIRACSSYLNGIQLQIENCDFEQTLKNAQPRDLVFLDPPYVTGHNNNGFRDWNEKLFSWADQQRLAELAHQLKDRGVQVAVSNADHPEIQKLYAGFNMQSIARPSTLASRANQRGRVTEAFFWSW